MKPETKVSIRRFALRWLRKLFDALEERLHAEEVKLRKELSNGTLDYRADAVGVSDLAANHPLPRQERQKETFLEWEARKSGIITDGCKTRGKSKTLRLKHVTASAFDCRFSSR
jgi:hypothetical protein